MRFLTLHIVRYNGIIITLSANNNNKLTNEMALYVSCYSIHSLSGSMSVDWES